jgi:hypothetical protein
MPAVIEVKYFNTFLLKKVNANDPDFGDAPSWNGSTGIPQDKGGYPSTVSSSVGNDWVIEEARIKGGYNNTSVSLGAKAYLVEEEPNGAIRGNSMIYSGIYNSRTGINNTNVFSVAENITKSVDPANGSIQKFYAEDTNLNIFQELKINRALIDKDAIYSAEGGGAVTSSNLVIGAIQPYPGKYGISTDPQSFAVYGTAKYFTDRNNNAVLKLTGGSIAEISKANMIDYFRDRFNTGIKIAGLTGKIIGGWDIYNKQYVVSTQEPGANEYTFASGYETLSWDETVQGWTSFYTYKPDQMLSLGNKFYSLKFGKLYEHYSVTGTRNFFYEDEAGTTAQPSSITFVFNPSVGYSKNFKTVDYEGSNGWQINSFVSDLTGKNLTFSSSNWIDFQDTTAQVYSYTQGEYDSANPPNAYPNASVRPFYYAGFNRKENKYVANLVNNSTIGPGEIVFGPAMSGIKGFFATVTIATDSVTDPGGEKELFAVGSEYVMNNGYQ